MKKANFSLEKFASANVKTLDANELNLIVGSRKAVGQCSDSNDTDSGGTNCSNHSDIDGNKAI